METYKKYRSALGYVPAEDSPIDSYGVDHSGFTTQDEVAYQNARVNRENELINRYNQQGINENYPQQGVGFWGDATNNYGFGHTNIGANIENVTNRLDTRQTHGVTAMQNQNQPWIRNHADVWPKDIYAGFIASENLHNPQVNRTDPNQYYIRNDKNYAWAMPPEVRQKQISGQSQIRPYTGTLASLKNKAENFASGTEAASVGFTTGASLGNFDEAMGAATAALTFNPDNYAMGRDATRKLQNDLSNKHPYIYNGAEILGASFTNRYIRDYLLPVFAGIGYANDIYDIPMNIAKNSAVSRFTKGINKIPMLSPDIRNILQNSSSWYLLNEENREK